MADITARGTPDIVSASTGNTVATPTVESSAPLVEQTGGPGEGGGGGGDGSSSNEQGANQSAGPAYGTPEWSAQFSTVAERQAAETAHSEEIAGRSSPSGITYGQPGWAEDVESYGLTPDASLDDLAVVRDIVAKDGMAGDPTAIDRLTGATKESVGRALVMRTLIGDPSTFTGKISADLVSQYASKYNMSLKAAQDVLAGFVNNPYSATFRNLDEGNIFDLLQAARSGMILPEGVTYEQLRSKYDEQQGAMQFLASAKMLDEQGNIKSEAFNSKNPDIKQALYDIGWSDKAYQQRDKAYQQGLVDWYAENAAMSKKAAAETIAAYKANPNDPKFAVLPADSIQMLNMAAQMDAGTNLVVVGQDDKGNDLVMTATQYQQQQDWEENVLPTLPDSIQADYRAGNLKSVDDYIDQQLALYTEQQAILSEIKSIPGAYTQQEIMPEGVYGPPKPESYDWVVALMSGKVTPYQLMRVGLDKSFIDATQTYATQVQGLIDKINHGVKVTGKGLSKGIGLTGSEAIDLGTAIREAGLNIEEGSAVNTWRNMTNDQKYQVAKVLTSYPGFGGFLPSTYRGLQSVASDEKLGLVLKTALTAATSPFTAIITPFVKDMTVGELRQKVDPYAKTDSRGRITDYNLTQYLKDNPYDAPLLARGGFSVDDIEKAQSGKKVNTMPEGATPLDWVIAGVMVASVALPVLQWGSLSLATRLVGGTGLTAATAPKAITAAMRALQVAYRGAAIGQETIKWGLPAGMTAYDIANWKNWTPEQRAVAGVFTGLTYIPVLGSLYRFGAGSIAKMRAMSGDSAILPRGLTTGYQDVYAVKPPPDFFAGVSGDTRTALMNIVNNTKVPTATRLSQVAALLEPAVVAPAFMQTAQLAMDISKFSVPSSQFVAPELALGALQGMTPTAASNLVKWLVAHPDVYIKGSTAMKAQGIDVTPHDLDLDTTSGKSAAADYKRQIEAIVGSGVGVDVSYPGKFAPMPYGLEKMVPKPVVIGGVTFQTVGEQSLRLVHTLLSPGVGESRGLMGPNVETLGPEDFPAGQVGTYEARIKDIAKFQLLVKYVINQLNATGEIARATKLQGYLDTFSNYQTRLADGSVKPLSSEETQDLQKAFLDAVSEVQLSTLVDGGNAVLLDPSTGLVVSKIVSPAGEVLPGTIYFASRDLTADISMLQTKRKWGPTGRQVFFSPEAAYDFLINRTTGKLGKNAGIIAVRTDPKVDMGPNGIITGPFRYEHIEGQPVVYNELVSEAEFYATEPNARAMSTDSVASKFLKDAPGDIWYRTLSSLSQEHMRGVTYYADSLAEAMPFGRYHVQRTEAETGLRPDLITEKVKIQPKNPFVIKITATDFESGNLPGLEHLGLRQSDLPGQWGDIEFDTKLAEAARAKGYDSIIFDMEAERPLSNLAERWFNLRYVVGKMIPSAIRPEIFPDAPAGERMGLGGPGGYWPTETAKFKYIGVLDESIVIRSVGLTGESVTYYPRTKTKVPILWTATKAAQIKGLGAPLPAEVSTINSMAWRESLWDLLHPHWAEVTTSEIPSTVKSGLIEFYKDTYKVKQLPAEKLASLVEAQTKNVLNDAVSSLKARGTELTESNILAEVNNIYRDRLTDLAKSIARAVGMRNSQELVNSIVESLARGAAVPVEEITAMLDSMNPATRDAVVKDAQVEYDASTDAQQKMSSGDISDILGSTKPKLIYYLNLGKISTKLATLASTASILTATAPAIASALIPATSITSPVSGIESPITTGGTSTSPTAPLGGTTVKSTTMPIPRITTPEIPTSVITPTSPTVPTTPTTPTTPTKMTMPTEPTTPITPPTLTTPATPVTPTTPTTTPKPTLVISLRSDGSKEARLPEGSMAWKQGLFWKWIPREDYITGATRPRTLPRGVIPIGARFTDQRTPAQTIQIIGNPGASVPDMAVDLGVADIFISDQAQTIRYAGKGEQTNVGVSVDSPTVGMTVEGGAEPKGYAYARKVYPAHSVSRTDMATEVPTSAREVRRVDRTQIAEDTKAMLEGTYEEPASVEPITIKDKSKSEDDFSDLTTLSDKDMEDIFGTGERKPKKKPVNRVNIGKVRPIRGQGSPTAIGQIRS
jgi:hypothetical protein